MFYSFSADCLYCITEIALNSQSAEPCSGFFIVIHYYAYVKLEKSGGLLTCAIPDPVRGQYALNRIRISPADEKRTPTIGVLFCYCLLFISMPGICSPRCNGSIAFRSIAKQLYDERSTVAIQAYRP